MEANKKSIERNFNKYIEYRIKDSWNDPAFQDYGSEKAYTYGEVAQQIMKFHLLFEEYGIQKGDKVALVGPNSSLWGIQFIAVATYGAVIVPILPDFKTGDIVEIIKHSDAKLAFFAKVNFEKLTEEDKSNSPVNILELETNNLIFKKSDSIEALLSKWDDLYNQKYAEALQKENFHLPEIHEEEILEISYTSGTSGTSKGVMLSHRTIFSNAIYILDVDYPLYKGDRILAFLPMAHSYGCAIDFLLPFFCGCHSTLLTKLPSPQILIKALGEVKPKHLLSVPLVIEKIYQNKLKPTINKPLIKFLTSIPGINSVIYSGIRKKLLKTFGDNLFQIILGGAPLNPEVEKFFLKIKFPFTVGYGMTECGPLISYAPHYEFKQKSCGRIIRGMEARIDSDDPENIRGEIQVKGVNLMSGYYKNEEATNEIITEDGWLRTGDMGVLDKDNFLFISGRCKSMLLGPSGQNIYPEEIENVFNSSKLVEESLAIQEDGKSTITLLVYPNQDLSYGEKKLASLLESERKKLNHKLAAYMTVKDIKIMDEEFLKTPKKTIKRYLYNQ